MRKILFIFLIFSALICNAQMPSHSYSGGDCTTMLDYSHWDYQRVGVSVNNTGGSKIVKAGVLFNNFNSIVDFDHWYLDVGNILNTGMCQTEYTLTTYTSDPSTYNIFFRGYLITVDDTVYGETINLVVPYNSGVSTPIVSLNAMTGISYTTAIANYDISSDGGDSVTHRGVCWSTSQVPTLSSPYTDDGVGVGYFESTLYGLSPNTTYYVRAYATNSAGTSYSDQLTFTTSVGSSIPTVATIVPNSIGYTTASSGGYSIFDNGASISDKGVVVKEGLVPTITNYDRKISNGSGSLNFISSIDLLNSNTTYHIRAYATNINGTGYGEDEIFATLNPAINPTVSTSAVTDITSNTATGGGNVSSEGSSPVTSRGLCYSTSPNPTTSTNITVNGSGIGSFTGTMYLSPSTIFYVRAYATNSVGTAYGNEVSFTSAPSGVLATVTTSAISGITTNSAMGGGNVTSDGGSTVTSRGICASTYSNPEITGYHTSDGGGTGVFTSTITGFTELYPNVTYHVRAYAINASGISYGADVSFTTLTALPTITTDVISSISTTTALSGGNVTYAGGGTISARGVCWSTSNNPTVSGGHTTDGTGTGVFSSSLTGLTSNTIYYVRAYATNSAGTAYGNETTFTTLTAISIPTLTTLSVTSITSMSSSSGGNITSDGGATVTARGICWNTSGTPTTSDSNTSNGSGTGSFTSSLTGLSSNTTYYVRAYATNSAGTAYGNEVSFTTLISVTLPILTTTNISSISTTTASSGGNITSDGGASITSRGVCWKISSGATISDSHTTDG
ncbi:MAG: beta strand repeat-containing protein, partial [Candidatus Doudnabacteria bacterium]